MSDIILFGRTGRLGSRILDQLRDTGGLELLTPDRSVVNMTNPREIESFIADNKPRIVINCTAFNGMEACDKDPIMALSVNTLAPAAMAAACRRIGAHLIHFSSDYAQAPTDLIRADTPNLAPYGQYGMSKYLGEIAAVGAFGGATVFRVSSIYGADLSGPLDCIKQFRAGRGTPENPIQVLRQCTTPTSVNFIAEFIVDKVLPSALIGSRAITGAFPLCTLGSMWKRDFAWLVLKLWFGEEAINKVRIVEGTLPCPRPIFSVMDMTVTQAVWDNAYIPRIKDDLEDFHTWVLENSPES